MKDHSAKQAAVFIKTKTDAGSFLKKGRLQIGCGADYKKINVPLCL